MVGVGAAYIKLSSTQGHGHYRKHLSDVVTTLYLLGTAFLYRYDAKLKDSFISFYNVSATTGTFIQIVSLKRKPPIIDIRM